MCGAIGGAVGRALAPDDRLTLYLKDLDQAESSVNLNDVVALLPFVSNTSLV